MIYLFSYIFGLLEFIFNYLFFKTFLNIKKSNITANILLIAITGTIAAFISDKNAFISSILTLCAYLSYLIFSTKHNITQSIIVYILSFICVLLSQVIVAIIPSILNLDNNNIYIQLLCNILTLIVILLFTSFIPVHKFYDAVIHSALPVKILLINGYLVFFCALLFFKSNTNTAFMSILYLLITFAIIIAINICVLYYDKTLQNAQKELESYQKNIPIYETLISELRANQHEYSNKLQSLQNLPFSCKDYDSLCSALNQYTANAHVVSQAYPLLQLNMPLLAATLYSLTERAAKDNITVHFNVQSTNLKSNAPEYVLSDLTAILLQNAIEACNDGDYIYAGISSTDGLVSFEVINPVDRPYSQSEIAAFFKKGYTTKAHLKKSASTPHGYGLYSLHQNILKYNGRIAYDCITENSTHYIHFEIHI